MATPQTARFSQMIRRLFSLKSRYEADVNETFMPTVNLLGTVSSDQRRLRGEGLFGFRNNVNAGAGVFPSLVITPPTGMFCVVNKVWITSGIVTNVFMQIRNDPAAVANLPFQVLDSRSSRPGASGPPALKISGTQWITSALAVVPTGEISWGVGIAANVGPIQYEVDWVCYPPFSIQLFSPDANQNMAFAVQGFERAFELSEVF